MKPWPVVGRARTPDGTELTLTCHDGEFALAAGGLSLMTSRMHASEDALGTLGCTRAATLTGPRVLVGGLGMGFTLRAALDTLPASAVVVVAEVVPEVVAWNRDLLKALAGHPLDDPRVQVEVGDVAHVIRSHRAGFDAVLLDVDNGPSALSTASNAGLYDRPGLIAARTALRPGGVLAVWLAARDRLFEQRLQAAGFIVRSEPVRGAARRRGPRHTVLVAEWPAADGRTRRLRQPVASRPRFSRS